MKDMLKLFLVAVMVLSFTGMSFAQATPATPPEKSGKVEAKKEEGKAKGKAKAKAKGKAKAEEKKGEEKGKM
jgi:hypothetical protein